MDKFTVNYLLITISYTIAELCRIFSMYFDSYWLLICSFVFFAFASVLIIYGFYQMLKD